MGFFASMVEVFMVVFNLVDVVILKFPTNSLALTQTRDFFTIVDFICINKK
jgi:hypothetical protein